MDIKEAVLLIEQDSIIYNDAAWEIVKEAALKATQPDTVYKTCDNCGTDPKTNSGRHIKCFDWPLCSLTYDKWTPQKETL